MDDARRWSAEAELLAMTWQAPGPDGRLPCWAVVERDGAESFVRTGLSKQTSSDWRRHKVMLKSGGPDPDQEVRARYWGELMALGGLTAPEASEATEKVRRRHESAAAAVVWSEWPFESLVADRGISDFMLARRGDDTIVTFIDDWTGKPQLIEVYVWRWPVGGIDPSEVGEFWFDLAEGSISGTELS